MKFRLYLTTAALSGAAYLLSLYMTSELAGVVGVSSPAMIDQGAKPLLLFLALFASATAFLLLLFRVYRGQFLYRLMFSLVVFLGLLKLFETVFPLEFSAIVAAVFLAGFFIIPTVWTHNAIVILASAGIGPVFALSFSESAAWILLLFLSTYDIIAVFVTKHMITLAHALVRSRATFALFVPERLRDFWAHVSVVRPGAGFLIFGGGDLVIPMLYLSTVARENMGAAVLGAYGCLVGIFCNHLFLVVYRRPVPALPLISLGALIGVAMGKLLI